MFLLLLSLGTSLPMIMGSFLVRPIPLPDEGHGVWDDYEVRNDSRTRLLGPKFVQEENTSHVLSNGDTAYTIADNSERSASRSIAEVAESVLLRNLGNRKVLRSGDFWLLATILSLRMCFQFLGIV